METQPVDEEVLAKAETLSPEELSRLVGELSKFLQEKYGKWATLKAEVSDHQPCSSYCRRVLHFVGKIWLS